MIPRQNKDGLIIMSIAHGLIGAATCGELPELSKTDAERSTGVLLLSAVASNLGYATLGA